MVVVCESCETSFRIDDARIPAKGRLVRCSQCKATFVAMPPAASFEDTVQDVVAEISAAGGAPVPEPATDLFDAGGEDLSDRGSRRGAGSDEERWEFDEAPRKPAAEVERPEVSEPREASADTAEPLDEVGDPLDTAEPLDEVGDPLEWDLLRESVEPAASEARFVEPARPAREAAVVPAPAPVLQPVVTEPAARRPARGGLGRSIAPLVRLGLTTSAWVVLAALTGAGLMPLLASGAKLPASRPTPRSYALAGGEARAVRSVFVENAFAGTLLVVEGELVRSQPDPALGLRVHLVDAEGRRLGEGALAGTAPPERDLRERAPEALRREVEANAAALAAGGTFAAVFEAPPRAATGLELALEPLPALEPPTVPVEMGPPEPGDAEAGVAAPPGASAPAEPTASSPPSARPSSG